MKVGDDFKVGYICDCEPHNYEIGKIVWIHEYRYYPNKNTDDFIIKKQLKIRFENGDELFI